MARTFLIIDGYNLMHAAGYARPRYGPGDLERRRGQFIRHLASAIRSDQLSDTTVVFDAFESSGTDRETQHLSGMQVQFAPPGMDADSEIEELLISHNSPRQIVVVSSDHRLQKAASRRGSKCVDSEIFWKQLTQEPDAHGAIRRSHSHHSAPRPRVPQDHEQGLAGPDDESLAELQRWADLQQSRWKQSTAPTSPLENVSPATTPPASESGTPSPVPRTDVPGRHSPAEQMRSLQDGDDLSI
ncbi:MAG: NYN domain-containing protein, partial [Planctomycetaceae bacterium]|nr:NYN domain-containing protein [Planctomycetaceae bacterium]